MPVARDRGIGRRRDGVQQSERIGRPFLLQQIGDKIQSRAMVGRIAGERLAQQRLRRLCLSGDAHQAAEIGGGGVMAWRGAQRPAHRGLGGLDIALAVPGDAIVHPGVRPIGIDPQRRHERLLGPARLIQREPGLAVGVMRLRSVRLSMAGVARGPQGAFRLAALEQRDRLLERGQQGMSICQ